MQTEAATRRSESFLVSDHVQAYEFRARCYDPAVRVICDGQILPRHVRDLAKTTDGLFAQGSVEGALTPSGRWFPVPKTGGPLLFTRIVDWQVISGHGPNFVAYNVVVTLSTETKTEQWQIRRRYRQFQALHDILKLEQLHRLKADKSAVLHDLPSLPPTRPLRRWIFAGRDSLAEERRGKLQTYLEALACLCPLPPALLFFLEADPIAVQRREALRALAQEQDEWAERLEAEEQGLRQARTDRVDLKAKLKDQREKTLDLQRKVKEWEKELLSLEPKRVQQHALLLAANRRLANTTPPRSLPSISTHGESGARTDRKSVV